VFSLPEKVSNLNRKVLVYLDSHLSLRAGNGMRRSLARSAA
jgi:hypothetical protein